MQSKDQISPRRAAIYAALGVALLLFLCWGSFALMARFAPTAGIADLSATLRDLLIILLAIEMIAAGVFMILMLWQLYQLIRVLREEVIPLLNTTKDTVEQLQHTTTFVGQSVSAPLISAAGFVAGMREMVGTLRGNRPPEEIIQRETIHLQQLQEEQRKGESDV